MWSLERYPSPLLALSIIGRSVICGALGGRADDLEYDAARPSREVDVLTDGVRWRQFETGFEGR